MYSLTGVARTESVDLSLPTNCVAHLPLHVAPLRPKSAGFGGVEPTYSVKRVGVVAFCCRDGATFAFTTCTDEFPVVEISLPPPSDDFFSAFNNTRSACVVQGPRCSFLSILLSAACTLCTWTTLHGYPRRQSGYRLSLLQNAQSNR